MPSLWFVNFEGFAGLIHEFHEFHEYRFYSVSNKMTSFCPNSKCSSEFLIAIRVRLVHLKRLSFINMDKTWIYFKRMKVDLVKWNIKLYGGVSSSGIILYRAAYQNSWISWTNWRWRLSYQIRRIWRPWWIRFVRFKRALFNSCSWSSSISRINRCPFNEVRKLVRRWRNSNTPFNNKGHRRRDCSWRE